MENPGLWIALAGIFCAVGIAGIGSAIGIGLAASTAAGALAEDESKYGKFLMLVALPGTQGIYGFLIAFIWLRQLNLLSAAPPVQLSAYQGLQILFACLPVAICGLSAIYQGKACSAGIALTARKDHLVGRAVVLGVFVEFYAVLGLLVSLFAWLYMGIG